MADDNSKYLKLITSEYYESENFNKYVKAFLDMASPSVDNLNDFLILFNLDNAVGDQLDKLGSLVSLTRTLPLNISEIPPVLPDDLFRQVIRARIYSNHWDGTIQGLNQIIEILFPNSAFEVLDNQDMSVNIFMIDSSLSEAVTALLFNGYIIPKPAGVNVNWQIQDSALFGWDSDTAFIKGWDEGIWNSN